MRGWGIIIFKGKGEKYASKTDERTPGKKPNLDKGAGTNNKLGNENIRAGVQADKQLRQFWKTSPKQAASGLDARPTAAATSARGRERDLRFLRRLRGLQLVCDASLFKLLQ